MPLTLRVQGCGMSRADGVRGGAGSPRSRKLMKPKWSPRRTWFTSLKAGFTGSGGNEVGTAMETGTRTIAQLNAAGITTSSNLLFVFHPSEPGGGPITIQDLALTFFNVATDNTFTATLPGTPMKLASTNAGSAANSGFAFRLDHFEAGLAAEFFSNPANRVGGAGGTPKI